ncbi:GDSL-type esterase/lipase family protein [Myxococcus stipitatus]|uniref:GDSL-type esterase/lipase family protein n=1 Tax=Myxococcus stipitatus TaxID=83455 RepID=UPI0030CB1AF0
MTHLEVGWGGWRAVLHVLACGGLLAACEIASEARPLAPALPPPAPPPAAVVASPPRQVAALAPPGVSRRVVPEPGERTLANQALARKLGAPGARLDDPCVVSSGAGCARTGLTPFFESLDALSSGTASAPTVIEAFGNSLIAGDRIVDILREDLSEGFGAAGRGVLLVDRMAPYGGRGRTGYSKGGWQPRTLGELRTPPHPFGITGVYHVATAAQARSRFKLEGEPHGALWWLDVPGAGALTVRSGDVVLARTEPSGSGQSKSTRFEVPAGTTAVDVVAEGKGAVVQGVVLQHARPGIVLDMLGVPSADASLYARLEDGALRTQLHERDPRLLVFFLGGNESKRLEWKRTDLDTLRADLGALLRRARVAAPSSACLVVGPMDAVRDSKDRGKAFTQRPFLEAVVSAEREVTLAEGCAFFNLYEAMGGKGSLERFHRSGYMHDDLVHPRGRGLDVLGHLVTEALLRAWVETPPSAGSVASRDSVKAPPPVTAAETPP